MRTHHLVPVLLAGLAVVALQALPAPALAQGAPGRGEGIPEWTMMYGGFKHLDDLTTLPDGTAWAVDRLQVPGGARQSGMVRWAEGIWRVAQVLEDTLLTAVSFAPPATGFAVGLEGAMVRWNGRYWEPLPALVRRDLRDVSLGQPDGGWACGDYGTLLRWDGQAWSNFPLAYPLSTFQYTAVAALPNGEAWATALGGQILRYRDGTWEVQETPEIRRPIDIAFHSPGRAMVVGGGALELLAGEWRSVGLANTSYRSVAWIGDDAYAVANDRLVRYRGGVWQPLTLAASPGNLAALDFGAVRSAAGGAWAVATSGQMAWLADGLATYAWPPSPRLEALDLAAPDTLWAAGEAVSAGFVGRVGGDWRTAAGPAEGATVWDLDLVDDGDGWGVSYATEPATTALWRWDGQSWSDWPADKTWRLSRVQMLDAEDGWLAGGNTVARWRGAGWEDQSGVPLGASGAVSMLRGGDEPWGWFGGIGTLFRLAGEEWTPTTLPALEEVLALDIVSAELGWAITATTLYRYNGTAWRAMAAPRPDLARFRDLDAAGAQELWVLLDPPGLLHWTGQHWQAHDLAPLGGNAHFTTLRACPIPGPAGCDEIWLAGSPPAIARYRVLDAVSRLMLPHAMAPE